MFGRWIEIDITFYAIYLRRAVSATPRRKNSSINMCIIIPNKIGQQNLYKRSYRKRSQICTKSYWYGALNASRLQSTQQGESTTVNSVTCFILVTSRFPFKLLRNFCTNQLLFNIHFSFQTKTEVYLRVFDDQLLEDSLSRYSNLIGKPSLYLYAKHIESKSSQI